MAGGALVGCRQNPPPVSADAVYTNNFYVAGVGYYHAPFRGWYPFPYNHFDAKTSRYFYGGQWGATPFESIINISSPMPGAVAQAEAARTDVIRGGFGSSYGGYHYIHA
jgi:hypothetical protein